MSEGPCVRCGRLLDALVALKSVRACKDCIEEVLKGPRGHGSCVNCGNSDLVYPLAEEVFLCSRCAGTAVEILGGPRLAASQPGIHVLRDRLTKLQARYDQLSGGLPISDLPYRRARVAGVLLQAIDIISEAVALFDASAVRTDQRTEAEVDLLLRMLRVWEPLLKLSLEPNYNGPPDYENDAKS